MNYAIRRHVSADPSASPQDPDFIKLRVFIPIAMALVLELLPVGAQAQSSPPREQLQQYVAELQRTPDDQSLRERIIKLAQSLNPRPTVPREVREHEGAAEYAFKNASTSRDFTTAAAEYQKALLLAPWLSPDYFNLGVAWEKAGEPEKAVDNLELYLFAEPNAPDSDEVAKRIGALKFNIAQKQADIKGRQDRERAAVAARDAEAAAQRRRRQDQQTKDAALREKLGGIWHMSGGTMAKRYYNDAYREFDVIDGDLIVTTTFSDKYLARYHRQRDDAKEVSKYRWNGHQFEKIPWGMAWPWKAEVSDDFTSITIWMENGDCNCKDPVWILTRADH